MIIKKLRFHILFVYVYYILFAYVNIAAIVVDLCKKNAEKGHTNPGELPVGYRSAEKNLVLLHVFLSIAISIIFTW